MALTTARWTRRLTLFLCPLGNSESGQDGCDRVGTFLDIRVAFLGGSRDTDGDGIPALHYFGDGVNR